MVFSGAPHLFFTFYLLDFIFMIIPWLYQKTNGSLECIQMRQWKLKLNMSLCDKKLSQVIFWVSFHPKGKINLILAPFKMPLCLLILILNTTIFLDGYHSWLGEASLKFKYMWHCLFWLCSISCLWLIINFFKWLHAFCPQFWVALFLNR